MPHLVSFAELCDRALAGEAICFPTDTVPALAARLDRSQAIYQLKQRSPDKPLVLMGDSLERLKPCIRGWEPAWTEAVERGWPGALTLILPASDLVPAEAISRGNTVGLRIPDLDIARQLLARTGPLWATSVNISGEAPLVTPEAIAAVFPQLPILHVKFPPSAIPSTVMKWDEGQWETLRKGTFRQ
ncbi:MAG: L-threonylcarbamoyladenylate synthase [Cyanobacteria bacterium J06648_11]